MGNSLSWAAVKNGSLQAICSASNFRPTGEREEEPESNIDAAEVAGGWYRILFSRRENDNLLLAARLSAKSEVVSCFVEDHVMNSSAAGWNRGRQIWKIFHDYEKARYHLDVLGHPQPELNQIRERLTQEQNAAGGEKADVDFIYDLPAELAKSLTRFRHDRDTAGMVGDVYHVLEPTAEVAPKTGLITRLTSIFKGNRQ